MKLLSVAKSSALIAILTVFRESNATNFESKPIRLKDSSHTAVSARLAGQGYRA